MPSLWPKQSVSKWELVGIFPEMSRMNQIILFHVTLFFCKGSTKLSFSEEAETNCRTRLLHSLFPNLLFQCDTVPKNSVLLFFLRDILTAVSLAFCWFSLFLPHVQFVKQFPSLCIRTQCQGPLSHSSMVPIILGATVPGAEAFLTFPYHPSIHPSHGSLQLAKAGKPGSIKCVHTGLVN